MVTSMPKDVDLTPGGFEPTPLSDNAVVVMERRITARNDKGDSIETPDECFRRVARNRTDGDIGRQGRRCGIRGPATRERRSAESGDCCAEKLSARDL